MGGRELQTELVKMRPHCRWVGPYPTGEATGRTVRCTHNPRTCGQQPRHPNLGLLASRAREALSMLPLHGVSQQPQRTETADSPPAACPVQKPPSIRLGFPGPQWFSEWQGRFIRRDPARTRNWQHAPEHTENVPARGRVACHAAGKTLSPGPTAQDSSRTTGRAG